MSHSTGDLIHETRTVGFARSFSRRFFASVRPVLRKPLHHEYSAMTPWPIHVAHLLVAVAAMLVAAWVVATRGVGDIGGVAMFATLSALAAGLLVRLPNDGYATFNETFMILAFVLLEPSDAFLVCVLSATWYLLRRTSSWMGGLGDFVCYFTDDIAGLAAVVGVGALLEGTGLNDALIVVAQVVVAVVAMHVSLLVSNIPYLLFASRELRAVISPIGIREIVDATLVNIVSQAPTVIIAAIAAHHVIWLAALPLSPLVRSWWATESAARLQEAREQARTDPLTGAHNRLGLLDQVAHRLNAGAGSIAFALGDIDDFKRINDTLGHAAGDEVLREVAAALQRESAGGDRVVARFGGEEFVVVHFGDSARESDLLEWAERVRAAIHTALWEHGSGISLGLSAWAGADDTFDRAIERADNAMYSAKLSGKNCVHVLRDEQRGPEPAPVVWPAPEQRRAA